ncbi:carbohydrate sulfotransferase 13-like [Patiria miniata]|uniref:Carbohydrate sulfotransferase n=1 Tax=Patiria miniata TaxID=46514 RepID=A0A914B0F2_PATMI|nr:carbohydrate sulfotransferase 13-like [Patiria miniata]
MENTSAKIGDSQALTKDGDTFWTNAKKEDSEWHTDDRAALETESYRYLHHPETVNETYDVWWTQTLRRKVLRETCDSLVDLETSSSAPGHLLVDDRNRFLFCEIRKVSSIAWRRVLDAVSSVNNSSATGGGHRRSRTGGLRRLGTYSAEERERRLREYTKFLFVREPMLRLVSGWRDKFVAGPQRRDYRSSWGPRIRRYYNSQLTRHSSASQDTGHQPSASVEDVEISFPEFVKYLTAGPPRSPLMRDMHWEPYRSRCRPCLVRYDFVGHYETLGPDAAAILPVLNRWSAGGGSVDFPIRRSDSLGVAQTEFPKLAPEDIVKLAKLYDVDYKLFGYSMSQFMSWLQKNSTAV